MGAQTERDRRAKAYSYRAYRRRVQQAQAMAQRVQLAVVAGAALVLAGLRARGETLVDHAELIDRGYDHLERQLSRLGGKVRRVSAVPGEA